MDTQNAEIIAGAGILGLAHANIAGRSGKRVVVFDRTRAVVRAVAEIFGLLLVRGKA
jgi:2-polyprenyl-6-methoxyphenol hydroxylase-like FAD-dependent oxidoreductase